MKGSALLDTRTYLHSAEAARWFGVSGKALRLYEAHGLIVTERTAAGWRVYSPKPIRRLHQVIALKSFGFPLSRIGELLSAGLSQQRKSDLSTACEAVAARHFSAADRQTLNANGYAVMDRPDAALGSAPL